MRAQAAGTVARTMDSPFLLFQGDPEEEMKIDTPIIEWGTEYQFGEDEGKPYGY